MSDLSQDTSGEEVTLYGVYRDISDELLANAKYPDQVIEDTFVDCENQVIRAMQNDNLVLTQVDMIGESFIRLKRDRWRHVVEPFDYEDEDGVAKHSEGWECTRIKVTGTIEEKS
jgi:hypothetical protein